MFTNLALLDWNLLKVHFSRVSTIERTTFSLKALPHQLYV